MDHRRVWTYKPNKTYVDKKTFKYFIKLTRYGYIYNFKIFTFEFSHYLTPFLDNQHLA